MKALLIVLILAAASIRGAIAAPQAGQGKTLTDIDIIPTRVLQRSVSPKFFKSLMISPIDAWVTVRADLVGTQLTGMKVIHSEPKGLHDHLALQRAKEFQLAGNFTLESPNIKSTVLVHLLIYQIADGTMALSFANVDGPGGEQMQYYGCAKLAVLKGDGKWVEIRGPNGLQGKGWAVRQGLRNDLATSMKLERLTTGAEATNMGGPGGR